MRAVLVLGLLVGCFKSDPVSPPPKPVPASTSEAEAWAAEMTTALNTCSTDLSKRLINIDAMAWEVVRKRSTSPAARTGFLKGAREGLETMLSALCLLKGDTDFRFLRVRQQGGETLALLRVVSGGMPNYVDYVVGKNPQTSKVQAYDALIYTTGQRATESLGGVSDAISEATERGASVDMMKGIQELHATGKAADAMPLFEQLPIELRDHRSTRHYKMIVAGAASDEAYAAAMQEFEKAYPDDPALDLVRIELALNRNDHVGALAGIERFERRIGGDAFFGILRARVRRLQERFVEASAELDRVVRDEPDLREAHWERVLLALSTGDNAGAAAAMRVLRDRLKVEITRAILLETGGYESFLQSPEAARLFGE
jgi:hypothetical protein